MAPPNPLSTLRPCAVIGHRGNSAHAPENTLHAFQEALGLGADGLEFDVRLTRDGVAVVFHDATLDRTTDGTGPVAAHTLEQLRRVDAGYRFTTDGGATFPFRGRGLGVSTLDEVLAAVPAHPVIIEVKERQASAEVRRVILARDAADRCTVGAFRHDTLRPFHGGPIARTCSSREAMWLLTQILLGRRPASLPFQSMSLPEQYHGMPVPLGLLARATAPAGVPVCVWTVNSPTQAVRLWQSGVRGVLSDDPGAILRARPRR